MCGSLFGGSQSVPEYKPVQQYNPAQEQRPVRGVSGNSGGDATSKRSAVVSATNATGGLGLTDDADVAKPKLKTTLGGGYV